MLAPQDAAERTLANPSNGFSSSPENGQSPDTTIVQLTRADSNSIMEIEKSEWLKSQKSRKRRHH
jgi:hypothetical protein